MILDYSRTLKHFIVHEKLKVKLCYYYVFHNWLWKFGPNSRQTLLSYHRTYNL